MNINGYVEINSDTLRGILQKALIRITAYREVKIEEACEKLMSNWFFPPKTKDKALERLKSSPSFISDYDFIMANYGKTEHICNDLLIACEYSDVVWVSCESISRIDGVV